MAGAQCPDFHLQDADITPRTCHAWQRRGRPAIGSVRSRRTGESRVRLPGGEHYDSWRRELPDAELPWGAFGENLTTEGLLEDEVWIGERYRVGTTELVVTQPRMPCYKLAVRFGHPDIVKRFLKSRRSGFYFAVAREGDVGAGDVIERLARNDKRLTIADVVLLCATDSENQTLLESAGEHPSLPAAWREYFRKRLWAPDA
jgi:MOSC domain-containing protein YiiM